MEILHKCVMFPTHKTQNSKQSFLQLKRLSLDILIEYIKSPQQHFFNLKYKQKKKIVRDIVES